MTYAVTCGASVFGVVSEAEIIDGDTLTVRVVIATHENKAREMTVRFSSSAYCRDFVGKLVALRLNGEGEIIQVIERGAKVGLLTPLADWPIGQSFDFENSQPFRQGACPGCNQPCHIIFSKRRPLLLDSLAPSWREHVCPALRLLCGSASSLVWRLRADSSRLLGVVVKVLVLEPGKSARFLILCSDGTTIDDVFEFDQLTDFQQCAGSLVRLSLINGELDLELVT